MCGCPPGPAQTVGGLRLHLRLRVGLRLSHSDNLSSHIPIKRRVRSRDSELLEYKKEGVGQWLHLRTIMPVDVHLSTASTTATLKISANEAACIDENTEWVLSQGRGGGRNKRQRCGE